MRVFVLQNAPRLSSPQSELQQWSERDLFTFFPEYADLAMRQRDPICCAAGAWRKGTLSLFQRNGVQQVDRGQQATD